MATITLSELHIYPIKSTAGISLQQSRMTSRGLEFDRRCMVVAPDGRFMTQRRFPKLALVAVESSADLGEQIRLSAPGMPGLSVRVGKGTAQEVEVWGDRTQSIHLGSEAQAWFSQFLGTPCQLVYMPESAQRPTAHGDLGADNLVSFADAYPYLLISEASLAELNSRLDRPVSMDRFRPNLVIRGCDTPHAEDAWKRVRIGEAIFSVSKPCARCSIPTVDQATGDRGQEPIKTLATYRSWDKAIWFGQNLVQENPTEEGLKTLHVGDEVEILT